MRKFGEKKTPEFLLAHIEKLNASCPGLGSFSPCDRKQEPGFGFVATVLLLVFRRSLIV